MIRRWSEMGRQKRVGWTIIIASLGYAAYFLKARLFAAGAPIETREWVYFILTVGGVMLGTINVRMAEMRERGQKIATLMEPPKKR